MDANGEADLIGLPADDVAATRPADDPPPGWEPVMPLDDGLARTIEWYSEHGVADAYTHLALKT
jgi:nucleoside-diphosphate-sugar epimerase